MREIDPQSSDRPETIGLRQLDAPSFVSAGLGSSWLNGQTAAEAAFEQPVWGGDVLSQEISTLATEPAEPMKDSPSTVFPDLAKAMLAEAARAPDSPDISGVLATYLESGVIASLTRPPSEWTVDDAAGPSKSFFEQTEKALRDGTLVPQLEQIAEEQRLQAIEALGPLARRRAHRAEAAAAQERYEARRVELGQMQAETMEHGSMPVASLRPKDEVTITLETYSVEENKARRTLTGVVKGHEVAGTGQDPRDAGAVLSIESDERTNPSAFTYDSLPSGTRVVLTGTALSSNGYVRDPGEMVKYQTPMIFWGDRKVPTTSRSALPAWGNRNLQLTELIVNGVHMFASEERDAGHR